jgi:orotidine-5'-phosphate decarboxylase
MNQIIVTLDNMDQTTAIGIAKTLKDNVWGFRIHDLIMRYGVNIMDHLKNFGNVFVDLKLHDAPQTVMNMAERLASAGADMISVHIAGGVKMIKHAREGAFKGGVKFGNKTKIIGVSMLDNLDFSEIRETYRGYPIERFFNIANKSNIDGVICSDHEIPFWNSIEKIEEINLIKIIPNIHPFGPLPVVDANFVCVGESLAQSKDPMKFIESIKNLYVEDEAS